MVTNEVFRQIALSFPDTVELPHFEKTSFRYRKKIFAALAENERLVTVKFTHEDQINYCAADENIIYPVPNKWGAQGWTIIDLKKVEEPLLREALQLLFQTVSQKKSK